jgi:16S rRNA (adenine1518-N6/adenine1519-N6)-dimethyltransferase
MVRKGTSPRRGGARLGQHFLTAAWAARSVAEAADIKKTGIVLEIGPGEGALTQELLGHADKVIAVEKDTALITHLHTRFADEIASGKLQVVESDIRDIQPESLGLAPHSYAIAANIPYYITGEIIRTFLTAAAQPHTMSLLVQKEVAERIARSAKESLLSLSVKAYGMPKYVATVPRGAFHPAPQVDSAILSVSNISRDFFSALSEEAFFDLLHAAFGSKRKMLFGNLKSADIFVTEEQLAHCNIAIKARAEDVPLASWKCLATLLGHK